jgi:23S rRNA pseudouridine955/2504/2580 synthase
MKEFTITAADAQQRLDKYLKRRLPEAGTSFLYKMLRKKNFTLNGQKAEGREILHQGDVVRLFLSDETYAKFAGIAPPEGTGEGRQQAPACGENKGTVTGRSGQQVFSGTGHDNEGATLSGDRSSFAERITLYQKAYHSRAEGFSKIRVLKDCGDIVLLHKPAGVLSQQALRSDLSLNEWFAGYLIENKRVAADALSLYTPSVANRLDRNTEGIVLGAVTLRGAHLCGELLKERSVHKFYQMVVKGRMAQRAGTIKGYLRKDPKTNTVRILPAPAEGADYTETIWRVLSSNGQLSLLEAELVTGKTHQLRAHLSSIGHPILGDVKYGDPALNAAYRKEGVRHQLLYCCRVEFPALSSEWKSLSGIVVRDDPPALYAKITAESRTAGRHA